MAYFEVLITRIFPTMLFTVVLKTFFKYILEIGFILLLVNESLVTSQLGGKIVSAEKIILRYLLGENLQIIHNMVGY